MKKLLSLLLVMTVLLVGCTSKNGNSDQFVTDGVMDQYAGFNGSDHHFKGDNVELFVSNLENKVKGIYYMGFADCPWCKALVPILEEVADETDHTIAYLNTRSTQFQGNSGIQERLQAFISSLPTELQNQGSVPFLIFIDENGNIDTHLGTVEGHDAPTETMTENEVKFLTVRLTEKFNKISK